MTTINSLTTSLYVSQTTISISSTSATRSDNEEQRPAVSGKEEGHGRHKHTRGGAFMHNVVQTLRSFGLNFPGKGDGSGSDDQDKEENGGQASSGNLGQILQNFLQDLREVLKQGGLVNTGAVNTDDGSAKQVPAKQIATSNPISTSAYANTTNTEAQVKTDSAQTGQTTPVTSTSEQLSPANTNTGSVTTPVTAPVKVAPRSSVADVGQALHSFLHELRQALRFNEDRRYGSDDDEDKAHHNRGIGRYGYGRFSDNLQDLIAVLSDKSVAVGDKYKELQDSFDELVGMLATNNNGKKPTLVEFLNKLAGNSSNDTPAPTAKGSIVSAVA